MKQATVYGGRTITVGDRVVYPGRMSSSLWLNEGTVEDIVTAKNWRDEEFQSLKIRRKANNTWEQDNKLVTVVELSRVVPLHD